MPISKGRDFEVIAEEPLNRPGTRARLAVLIVVALVSTLQLNAQSAVRITLVKAGRLLDPRSGNVLVPPAVLL